MAAALEAPQLGVFLRDRARSVVVVSDDGELSVALRDRVEPELAVIRDVRAAECAAALDACEPWPWMVVCHGPSAPPALRGMLASRPTLAVWYGTPPRPALAQARVAPTFAALVDVVGAALHSCVGGMRLAAGTGIDLPDGGCIRCAALEALIAAHPGGFRLPMRAFRSATRVLRDRGIPWRPQRRGPAETALLAPYTVQAPGIRA